MKKTVFTTLVLAMLAGVSSGAARAATGDAAAGHQKATMCIGCHGIPGYRASFPEVHQVPMISGQGAKYIISALTAYQKGDRKHPTMRAIADPLSEQDMADLAAYYESHKVSETGGALQPNAAAGELLKRGSCTSCHGENLSKPIDGSYPKLAGQPADYLFVALKAYKTENHAQVGRDNAIMGAQVKSFSNAELKTLAGYISSLPSELSVVPNSRMR